MEKSSFFNSVSGDRKYKAEDYASYFSSFIGNGIFPNPSTNLQILSNNNMTVTLKSGKAWINGYFYSNTDNLVLSIDVADGVLKRIDRVVLRLDYLNREIKTYVKKGTFASSPVAPTLQRDADIYELGLADVLINNGATSITQANITDLRLDSTKCGIVTGTVDQIDATTLFAQYDAEFSEWFNTVKGSLSGDVAGNLQAQITNVDDKVDTLEQNVTSSLGERTTILTASGTVNAITLPITFTDKIKYSFKSISDSTGVVTINGIALKKLDGTAISNIRANKVYDIFYDQAQNSVFILAKAEGTALVGDVLAGKTFSNDDSGGLLGTLLGTRFEAISSTIHYSTGIKVIDPLKTYLVVAIGTGGNGGDGGGSGTKGSGGGGGGGGYVKSMLVKNTSSINITSLLNTTVTANDKTIVANKGGNANSGQAYNSPGGNGGNGGAGGGAGATLSTDSLGGTGDGNGGNGGGSTISGDSISKGTSSKYRTSPSYTAGVVSNRAGSGGGGYGGAGGDSGAYGGRGGLYGGGGGGGASNMGNYPATAGAYGGGGGGGSGASSGTAYGSGAPGGTGYVFILEGNLITGSEEFLI